MALTLDVDGRRIENPDSTEIARAFESLDKRTGFLHGGLSLVTLAADETHSLGASGHPVEGFTLCHRDEDPKRDSFSRRTLTMQDVIKAFQRYAQREDWGKAGIDWDELETLDGKRQAKRLLWILAAAALLFGFGWLVILMLRAGWPR